MTAPINPQFFSDLPHPVDFFIMRHGESEANADSRIQGKSDYPLNEQGRAQARAAAEWFRDKGIRAAFCSPLKRATETATLVCAGAGLEAPDPLTHIAELDTGIFTALTMAQIRDKHPEDYKRFLELSWEGVPGAESCASLKARAGLAWAAFKEAARASGGNVLAVTHGGMIQWLVRTTFGMDSWIPVLPTGNCCVYRLSVQPNGPGRPAYLAWKDLNTHTALEHRLTPQAF